MGKATRKMFLICMERVSFLRGSTLSVATRVAMVPEKITLGSTFSRPFADSRTCPAGVCLARGIFFQKEAK